MKLPKHVSKWLLLAVGVHGFLGSYTEILDTVISRLATPLGHFYNESISAHYGYYLDNRGLLNVFSIYNTLLLLGSILSTLFFVPLMDVFGRKIVAVYLRSFMAFLACFLIILAKNINAFELFGVAMILVGVGKPLRIGVTKLYMSECAPDQIRGFATLSISVMSLASILSCYFLSMEQLLGTDDRWIYFPYIALVFILVFVVAGSFIPESPKYLKLKDKSMFLTVDTIKKFHGEDVDMDAILDNYETEFDMTSSHRTNLREVLKDPALHASLKIVLVVTLFPALGADQILTVNSIPLKLRYGWTNANALLFDTVFNFGIMPLTVGLAFLVEKIGRRPLLLFSISTSLLSSVFMLITQFIYQFSGKTTLTVVLSGLFSAMQSLSTGTGALIFYIVLIADLLPANSKSVVTQCAIIVSNVTSILVNMAFSSFDQILGGFIHVPFIILQCLFLYNIFTDFVETKQKPVFENFAQIRSRANSKMGARSRLQTSNSNKNDKYGAISK